MKIRRSKKEYKKHLAGRPYNSRLANAWVFRHMSIDFGREPSRTVESLINHDGRIMIMEGGKRSGKSLALLEALAAMREAGKVVLVESMDSREQRRREAHFKKACQVIKAGLEIAAVTHDHIELRRTLREKQGETWVKDQYFAKLRTGGVKIPTKFYHNKTP